MNKQTKALELAREALEKCDSALAEELAAWDIDPPLHHVLEASNACGPALAAIREAQAEMAAQQEPVAWANPNDLQNFDMKVRTNGGPLHTVPLCLCNPAPTQQAAEPVARVDYTQRDGFHWLSYLGWQRIPDGALLYTSPQSTKPWVGLTPQDFTGMDVSNAFEAGAWWADATLQEKNT